MQDAFLFEIPRWNREDADLKGKIENLTREVNRLKAELKKGKRGQKELLTRQETAELCGGVGMTTLFNWKKAGKLKPRLKAGSKPLYHIDDVMEFLKAKKGGDHV